MQSAQDYYPFGSRTFSNGRFCGYRFSFNGMENDDELKGAGNSYDFGARIHDPRLGRWLSLDPLQMKYPFISPYTFAANKPIMFLDYDGRDIIPSNQFKASAYYKVVTTMVSNLNTLPTANKYLAPFLASGKDLQLRFHSLSGREMGAINNDQVLGVTMNQDKAKLLGFQSITFNADATFKQEKDKNGIPERQNGDEFVGNYVSEIGMANAVIHEAIHATGIDHELMASPALRAEMKSAMLDYAKLQGIKLSPEEADAMSWNGLQKTDAWKNLPEVEQKKITSTINRVVYGEKSSETSGEYSERMSNQESTEEMTNETIK